MAVYAINNGFILINETSMIFHFKLSFIIWNIIRFSVLNNKYLTYDRI